MAVWLPYDPYQTCLCNKIRKGEEILQELKGIENPPEPVKKLISKYSYAPSDDDGAPPLLDQLQNIFQDLEKHAEALQRQTEALREELRRYSK